ncbi:S8 family peptidase [Pseudobacteriovorax antillogorgiicola]|uniref:Subtilase family protein n=1 Tax=Pseudobacteriovorax antillogorgiicola TaxID=1513793 RepID=A0A1Y6CG21_9BACT|nr:S8 family peptidase [Pseudobacteriovorax antillogorgiicola]TCS47244.1 subtilase family protein [Pseudobacteriovorax antillogorgiicola]SMF62006.1 Subtilase family protein [Pseudobacteriovorax antillogorgiicola]
MLIKSLAVTAGILWTGAAWSSIDMGSLSQSHVDGELIITFSEGVSHEEKLAILEASGASLIKEFKSSNAALVKVEGTGQENTLEAAGMFARTNAIARIGLNRIFKINARPSDPSFSRQYQYDLIGAEEAWDITTGSKDIVVGVIDTGIVYNHPDLEENIWRNPGETGLDDDGNDKSTNGIDDDGNGYVDDFRGWDFAEDDNDPMDDHGHGTHCAGSIGAVSNNGEGIAGLNWNVTLVPLRFITARGEGTEADAIEAIEYATMMGFDMTSNSWGGDAEGDGDGTDPLYEAIKKAGEAGQLFIAAAGNDGRDTDRRPTFPASYDLDTIISVASSDSRDRMSGFSNYGASTVDLLAPGSNVYSTIKRGWFGNYYGNMSGTSMAAPIVAGAAALIKSEFPKETPLELKARILDGAEPVSAGKGKLTTEGRLNVFRSLTL